MRHVGNFNPEWGYLAPAPSLLRTARVLLVATAIGAITSAAVIFSLIDRPAAETTIAARTLVLSAPATKLMAQQPTQSVRSSVSPTSGGEAMGAARRHARRRWPCRGEGVERRADDAEPAGRSRACRSAENDSDGCAACAGTRT
jgi:hypothetical protein